MCFTEFIGYTCGHTSIPVARPCPMTTHLYTNPCCPKPACRPLMALGMCPPCARILHGRWVNILEFEHRWMHERGVCGCAVKFPALQHPRVVSGPGGNNDDDNKNNGVGPSKGLGKSATSITTFKKKERKPRYSNNKNAKNPNRGQGGGGGAQGISNQLQQPAIRSTDALPLYEETDNGTSVLMSSVWAAEWLKNHGERHRQGVCNCDLKFEKYKGYDELRELAAGSEYNKDDESAVAGVDTNRKQSATTPPPPGDDPVDSVRILAHPLEKMYAVVAPGKGIAYVHDEAPGEDPRGQRQPSCDQDRDATDQRSHGGSRGTRDSQKPGRGHNMYNRVPLGTPAAEGFNDQYAAPGKAARYGCSPFDASLMANNANANANDNANNSHPYPPREQFETHPIDMATIQYDEQRTPIAGFPIGAGPEGDSHAGDFAYCELRITAAEPIEEKDEDDGEEPLPLLSLSLLRRRNSTEF